MDKGKKKRHEWRALRTFTAEFKAEAVRLCRVGDRSIAQVASDLDLTETALREWVKRAAVDAGKGPPGPPLAPPRPSFRAEHVHAAQATRASARRYPSGCRWGRGDRAVGG